MKKCSRCSLEKEENEFFKRPQKIDGLDIICISCRREKYTEHTVKCTINNRCRICTKPKLKYRAVCLYHWAMGIIDSQNRNRKIKLILEDKNKLVKHLLGKLSNQNFKCAYSGVVLIPGINCSLEHKEAYSLQGNNEVFNLVWVDSRLNNLKNNREVQSALFKFNAYVEALKTGEYPK